MNFNVLAVRSGMDTDDDPLYPALSDASGPEIIALEAYDGPNVSRVVATAVSVMRASDNGLKTLAKLADVKIDVYITDGRVALACEKYDKGGGWVGFGTGALVAVAANAVSKARAASRSRGKVLVGHIRYPWVKAVGASSKSGFTTSEAIRLEYSDKSSGTQVRKVIDLTLPKNIDATLVAAEIARRAAAFRLAYDAELGAEEREKFASLSQGPPRLQPQPRKFAFYHMPTYFHVNARTAFPASAQPRLPEPAGLPRLPAPPRFPEPSGPPRLPAPPPRPPGVSGPPRHAAPPELPARAAPRAGTVVDGRQAAPGGLAGSAPASAFCTQCGTRHVPGDNFCAQCGVPVQGIGNYQGQGVTSY